MSPKEKKDKKQKASSTKQTGGQTFSLILCFNWIIPLISGGHTFLHSSGP
jgi:hypothetical protein